MQAPNLQRPKPTRKKRQNRFTPRKKLMLMNPKWKTRFRRKSTAKTNKVLKIRYRLLKNRRQPIINPRTCNRAKRREVSICIFRTSKTKTIRSSLKVRNRTKSRDTPSKVRPGALFTPRMARASKRRSPNRREVTIPNRPRLPPTPKGK